MRRRTFLGLLAGLPFVPLRTETPAEVSPAEGIGPAPHLYGKAQELPGGGLLFDECDCVECVIRRDLTREIARRMDAQLRRASVEAQGLRSAFVGFPTVDLPEVAS